jgi:hypothetical protein
VPIFFLGFLTFLAFLFKMTECGVFVLRPGRPWRGLQLVKANGSGIRSVPFMIEPANMELTWRLLEGEISEHEKQTVRYVNFLCEGNTWNIRICRYYLQCDQADHVRFRICQVNVVARTKGFTLPARTGSFSIPLTNQTHQYTIPNAGQRDTVDKILSGRQNVAWFQEGTRMNELGRVPRQIHNPGANRDIQGAQPHVPIPVALSAFIANTLVQHAKSQADAVCPITQEPLNDYTKFSVGNCGHVFSDIAATLDKCPYCSTPVAWTAVEIPA